MSQIILNSIVHNSWHYSIFKSEKGKRMTVRAQREKRVIIFLISLNHQNFNILLIINSPTLFRNLLDNHTMKKLKLLWNSLIILLCVTCITDEMCWLCFIALVRVHENPKYVLNWTSVCIYVLIYYMHFNFLVIYA